MKNIMDGLGKLMEKRGHELHPSNKGDEHEPPAKEMPHVDAEEQSDSHAEMDSLHDKLCDGCKSVMSKHMNKKK